jgi:hypothetical protein
MSAGETPKGFDAALAMRRAPQQDPKPTAAPARVSGHNPGNKLSATEENS